MAGLIELSPRAVKAVARTTPVAAVSSARERDCGFPHPKPAMKKAPAARPRELSTKNTTTKH